jgi:two-component sensor histidine kinase
VRQTIEVDSTPMEINEWNELPLPRSMVQYVARTAKSQIIHDARQETQFSKDPYFLHENPLSILCEPIIHQGKLVGILYLENNLTADAFTEERLELLRLLSSQAAISIENASLYADMEKRIQQRTSELAESLKTVNTKSRQVSTLLNNSGQGFLSVGRDLIVEPEFSQACLSFFEHSPAGQPIDQLLLPDDPHGRGMFRDCLTEALTDEDPDRRHIYLSLLPEEISIGAITLKAEFKPLDGAIMVVLTDISEEKALAAQVARERTRLEMIVAAVTSGSDFFDAVTEFESFIQGGPSAWLGRDTSVLYRAIHTFKGTFNQLGFHLVPSALHAVETSLQHQEAAEDHAGAVAAAFAPDWADLLRRDLDAVSSALGADFMARCGGVTIPPNQARRFEMFGRGRLDKAETPRVLSELAGIRSVSLRQSLADYDKLIQQIAARMEKAVLPLKLTGIDVGIDPDAWGPCIRSLGHIFRNALDHGIESPESRLRLGKSEFGCVICDVSIVDDRVILKISDDGGGIDEDALRQRAGELGFQHVQTWNLVDLVFGDGISCRSETTELSGRGVGMGAVRAAVEDMNGSIRVESSPGQGTSILIRIPLPKEDGE